MNGGRRMALKFFREDLEAIHRWSEVVLRRNVFCILVIAAETQLASCSEIQSGLTSRQGLNSVSQLSFPSQRSAKE